jgi:murein DD-endopeptidase MepM/ murein hydrolase activator NlpD
MRIPRVLGLLLLLAAPALYAQSQGVTLMPAIVEAGSPELIRVQAASATSVEGQWLGRKLQFFPGHTGNYWYALAGVDVEAKPGPSTIALTIHIEGHTREISTPVPIRAAHYRTGTLTVPPKFVEPGPDDQKLIETAVKAKEKAFAAAASSPKPLWSGSFEAPVQAAATDSFGTRRTFNGKLASIHKGTDFRAASGTPVRAGNSGTVLLAQPLYYEGNCVMVDHGQGLISISMHLSRIDVKPGQSVEKGQQLGLSGATGRVTGPHLHWAIRWQGAMLDPAKLLKMNLTNLP